MTEENQETPDVFSQENTGNQDPQEGQQTETPSNEGTPNPDSIFADQLGSIKNENGVQKYETVSEALKGAAHAQSYIQDLKQQLEDANNKLQERDNELKELKEMGDVFNSQNQQEATTSESLDENKIEELLDRRLSQREQEQVRQRNRNEVNSFLVEQFGDTKAAKESFEAKARELDMSPEDLTALAEKSPKAVTNYFGEQKRSVDVEGSKRTDAFKGEEDVDYNIFSSARKKDQRLKAWRAAKPNT